LSRAAFSIAYLIELHFPSLSQLFFFENMAAFHLDLARSGESMKGDGFTRMVNGTQADERKIMAGQSGSADSIYKIVEVIGTSTKSWEDAAKNAVETAARTLRELRIAEVVKMDMTVKDGKVRAYRTRVLLSFKYES